MTDQTEEATSQDDSGNGIPYRILGIAAIVCLLVCCGIPAGYCGIGAIYSSIVGSEPDDPNTPWKLLENGPGIKATTRAKGTMMVNITKPRYANLTLSCVEGEFNVHLRRHAGESDAPWYDKWHGQETLEMAIQFSDEKKSSPWVVERDEHVYTIQDSTRFGRILGNRTRVLFTPELGRNADADAPIWSYHFEDKDDRKVVKKVLNACDIQPIHEET